MKDLNEKSKYVSLAPRDEGKKEYKEYYDALDFAMKDKSIRNIAITGPYGSGKSSVINSYFNNRKGIKCVRISLAYFNFIRLQNKKNSIFDKEHNKINESNGNVQSGRISGANKYNKTTIDQDLNENDIESEVLKNLFYSIDGNKLKNNRFLSVRSKKGAKDSISQWAFIISLIVVAFLTKLLFTMIDKVLFNKTDIKYLLRLVQEIPKLNGTVIFLLALIPLIIFINNIVKNYDKFLPNIKSIIFKNTNIDMANTSIINNYLHEIINFMIDVEESVFIFEDLDRYNNYSIFEKLRNLCILINNNEIIKKKFEDNSNVSCIKFIYAIKDDFVFDNNECEPVSYNLSDERTKFFDFVIPIIPLITQNNVRDVLVENIERLQLNDITDDYITIISIYLSNLRMINNIFNEFQIYKKTINSNSKDFDNRQLLTLIIFKNLYPKEFVEYQQSNIFNKIMMDIKDKKFNLLKGYEEDFEKLNKKAVTNINALNSQEQIEYKNAIRMIDVIKKDKIEVYDEIDIRKIFNQCNNNEFLMTAIRYGFINDAVSDYINYFYPNFIDSHDKEFIKSIYAGNDIGADYKLHNVERIYNTLQEADFSTKLIVNYDLIKYALHEEYNNVKTEMLCNVIIDNYMLLFNVIKYFESFDRIVNVKLITKCKSIDEEFFLTIFSDDNVYVEDKSFILDKLLLYLNEIDISEMNKDKILSNFVNNNLDMIYDKDEELQKLYLNRLNIKCENVKYITNNKNQSKFIYMLINNKIKNEECFAYKDLLKIYYLYKDKFNDNFENDNLKFIYNSGDNNVIDNIKTFPDEYVENCLLETNIEFITIDNNMVELLYSLQNEDNVKNIIKGLKENIDIVTFDYKGKIIADDDNDEIIKFYDKRKKLISAELLNNDNISFTMYDLYKFFSEFGWGEPLTKYISNNIDKLLNHNIKIENVDDNILRFYKNMILNCKSINNIEKLLGNNKISLQSTELVSLPPNLVENLLQGNNIKFDINCMKALHDYTFKGIEWYIYFNIDDFININQFDLLSEDILEKIIGIINDNKEKTNVDNDNINTIFTSVCQLINKKYAVNLDFDPDGMISNFIISSNYTFNYHILNHVLYNKDIDVIFDILFNRLEYISIEDMVGIIKSSNSPFNKFLDNNTKVYTIKKDELQKSFRKVKRIVNFIVKQHKAETIENQDINTIEFKLL